jgi:hypothetical protein
LCSNTVGPPPVTASLSRVRRSTRCLKPGIEGGCHFTLFRLESRSARPRTATVLARSGARDRPEVSEPRPTDPPRPESHRLPSHTATGGDRPCRAPWRRRLRPLSNDPDRAYTRRVAPSSPFIRSGNMAVLYERYRDIVDRAEEEGISHRCMTNVRAAGA